MIAICILGAFVISDLVFWWLAYEKGASSQKWWVAWIPGSGFLLYASTSQREAK